MCIVAFLLNAFSQAIGITVAKKDFVLEFNNYVKSQGGDLKKFTCNMTRDLHITSVNSSKNIGRQITFGFPYNEMGEFFENLKPLWYEDQKYKCDKFSDPDKLLIYNYIVCVLAKYKDFYLKQGISVTSQGKNEWGIMPRRPLTELTQATGTSEIWAAIKESDFFNDKAFQWAYCILHDGGSIGGHTGSLNTKFDKNGHQLIFECRSVPDMLLQYFDYDPIDISLNFKDKFEKDKEDEPPLSEPW